MGESFTTEQVSDATGATLRQLSYWCRRGFIPDMPTDVGSGSDRVWTSAGLEAARWLRVAATFQFRASGTVILQPSPIFVRRGSGSGGEAVSVALRSSPLEDSIPYRDVIRSRQPKDRTPELPASYWNRNGGCRDITATGVCGGQVVTGFDKPTRCYWHAKVAAEPGYASPVPCSSPTASPTRCPHPSRPESEPNMTDKDAPLVAGTIWRERRRAYRKRTVEVEAGSARVRLRPNTYLRQRTASEASHPDTRSPFVMARSV